MELDYDDNLEDDAKEFGTNERPRFELDSGKWVDAANFAFLTTTGIDPDPDDVGLLVEHTCGNDLCMNPSHMQLPQQN